ncbi:ankyrin repeat-containing domain protein [Paraphoma chrysanthemicola]|nr:ankyrin repeat-containing domain protein [Paraphoma chrysanthemicola]
MQLQPDVLWPWDDQAVDCASWVAIEDNGGELDVSVHRAAARGDVAEISRLLDARRDIDARCSNEKSALHYAIVADKTEAVRFLLSRGADPNLRGQGGSDGREGDDAALCAARFEKVSVMEVLVASGIAIHSEVLGFAVISKNMDMIRLLVGTRSYDFTDVPRLPAIEGILPAAVHTWSLENVQYLMEELKYNASTIATNNHSVLNLALLAVFKQEDVHDQLVETESDKDWDVAIQIIQLLVAAGASVDAVDDWVTRTPLHFALQLQYPPPELIDYLLVHNADINISNYMGCTPFFQLLTRSDATEEMVRRFQRLGGSLDVMDEDRNTPLHLVKRPEIASLLLVSGADPAAKNKYGQTPLHLASCAGDIGVITQLLDHGVDMEAKDSSGETPLLSAMSYTGRSRFSEKDEHAINCLLERGANIIVDLW